MTADYLLGLSESKNHPNADLTELRLSDDMIELLKSGLVDARNHADNPQQYYIPDSVGGNWVFLLVGYCFFVMGLGFIALLTKA